MSAIAVPTSSISQGLQSYFHERNSDLSHLAKALKAGNLDAAQQEYSAIQTLGQSGPFANGDAFTVSQRQQYFDAIGQALQNGDLAAARQALVQLRSTFHGAHPVPSPAATADLSGSAPTPAPIVLNLGNVTPGEQITIGVKNAEDGTEQVTIGIASQQNQSPEQITLNLNQNSNQQIILNLFNSSDSSSTQGSSVNATA